MNPFQVVAVNPNLNERVYVMEANIDNEAAFTRSVNYTMRQMAERGVLLPVEYAAGFLDSKFV